MAWHLRQGEPGWLQAWDEIDRECQRVEHLMLGLLFAGLGTALSIRFCYALVGQTAPSLAAELPAALMIALVLLSASAALAEFCRRHKDEEHVQSQSPAFSALRWLLTALICSLMAGAGLRYLAFDVQLGSSSPLGLPGWWQLAPIPLIFLIMALRLVRLSLSLPRPGRPK